MMMVFLVFSCGSNKKLTSSNIAGVYKTDGNPLLPELRAYHFKDSLTKVYFKLHSSQLLHLPKKGHQTAFVKISYKLKDNYESSIVLDTASMMLIDTNNHPKSMVGSFEVPVKRGEKKLVEVDFMDMQKSSSTKLYLIINKTDSFNNQNFLITNKQTGTPIFENYLLSGKEVKIEYALEAEKNTLIQYIYTRSFPLAPPPFSYYSPKPFDFNPDSIADCQLNQPFRLEKPGLYHLVFDSNQIEGLSFRVYQNDPTEFTSIKDMVFPLRYITTKKEYMELTDTAAKARFEKFWIDAGSNPTKSRQLVKSYYNRVLRSNQLFTSHQEGWKTDRGMIYIVFGPPNIIYKTSNSENWIYGEENNFMSLNFAFKRLDNPFTDNHYLLSRSTVYKSTYYKAVDSWRQGRILSYN